MRNTWIYRETCALFHSSYSSVFRVGFRVFRVGFRVFRVGFRVFRVGFRVFRVGSGCSGRGSGFYRHPEVWPKVNEKIILLTSTSFPLHLQFWTKLVEKTVLMPQIIFITLPYLILTKPFEKGWKPMKKATIRNCPICSCSIYRKMLGWLWQADGSNIQ
jgi:hypothetical protein